MEPWDQSFHVPQFIFYQNIYVLYMCVCVCVCVCVYSNYKVIT